MGDIVDSENIPQAIKHLQVSIDSRLSKFGPEDPVVKRKQKEIDQLNARAQRVAAVGETKTAVAAAK